jgi:hypothetical protein
MQRLDGVHLRRFVRGTNKKTPDQGKQKRNDDGFGEIMVASRPS